MSSLTQIAGFDATGSRHPRRKTYGVRVGHVQVGGGAPIVIQSMTNTDTADVESTLRQTLELAEAGSEIVRWTVNVPQAAAAVLASSKRFLVSGTSAAASGTLTVQRTISEPASATSRVCLSVDSTSAVSVLVMDWMTMGAPPPTWTWPTLTP